ncbi:hypothetical protein QBC32DRAFT_220991 [Pseudoneurospora amorphoporcata]|uniref:Uncharacterized protein n=1 Tax=Pseudoneurospora amorphoporcata TaxID=241081 RepID=A0AAN6SCS0_9PEZI|nr:hypothetical protein QBC32DRAFT_220991 [Pseudoneurospora amorphoporcata]
MAAGYLEAFGGGGILDLASSNTCPICAVCSGMATANGPELDNQTSRPELTDGGGGKWKGVRRSAEDGCNAGCSCRRVCVAVTGKRGKIGNR